MKPLILATTLFATLTMAACAQASLPPEALAKSLQSALDKGDFEAARQLAEIDSAPAQLHFLYFDTVSKCASEATCTVTTAVADDGFRQELKAQAEQLHAQAPAVEGMVKIAVKSKDGKGSSDMEIPYAKVGGNYKLTSIHFSPAEFAALRARSDDALVEELFAQGIRDDSGEMRTDWATAATRLPADGGDPGKAFVAQTKAMSAAVDAGDPDAAMLSGGQIAKTVFRDKDSDGKPIPLADRKRKLHVQSLRMLGDVKIKGGYQLGYYAVLLIESRNGIGWVERGPIVLTGSGNNWDRAGSNTVSYPAAK